MQSSGSLTIAAPHTSDELRGAVLLEALTGLVRPDGVQKSLSPWLFYDETGSQLFEQITGLPEYYLTRTERGILETYSRTLPAQLGAPVTLAELGAGSAAKTGILLREFAAVQAAVLYQPIDVSASALAEASASIETQIPGVQVQPQVANYITDDYSIARQSGHKVLVLYIGSSIGNFSPPQAESILRNLHSHLKKGDKLLLGVDLAPGASKSVTTLIAAYDDRAGVTAAFNKNILTRLNRELDADFELDGFRHRARWNADQSRIEMHLESLRTQVAHVAGKRIEFALGETIHTENSYKFTKERLRDLLTGSGFAMMRTMCDANDGFAVVLAEAV